MKYWGMQSLCRKTSQIRIKIIKEWIKSSEQKFKYK